MGEERTAMHQHEKLNYVELGAKETLKKTF
jgi:hypothetical protein